MRWSLSTFPTPPGTSRARTWSGSEVARDDLLDAYAVLWTALRFARGPGHYRELGDGARDAYGLRQRIVDLTWQTREIDYVRRR